MIPRLKEQYEKVMIESLMKKLDMKNLKYESKPYPTDPEQYVPPVEEIEVESKL